MHPSAPSSRTHASEEVRWPSACASRPKMNAAARVAVQRAFFENTVLHLRRFFLFLLLTSCVDRADAGSFEPPPPPGTPPPGDDGSQTEAGAPDGVPTVHLDPVSTALAAGGLATC